MWPFSKNSKYTKYDADKAALEILHPLLSSCFISPQTKYARIKAWRDWLKTQTDKTVVSAYNEWLDYFERIAKDDERVRIEQDRITSEIVPDFPAKAPENK